MDIAKQRLAQQRLTGLSHARPEDVVSSLLAVQAQDYQGAKWAVAQRMLGASDAEVHAAYQAGRILRTHVLRPTWHFVAPGDIRWLLELTAPRVHALNAFYYRKHGLDAAMVKRSRARILKALSGGTHWTRAELAQAICPGKETIRGERLAYFIMRAELDGVICSGRMRGKQHTYALLEERVAPAPTLPRDEALAEVARLYVSGHGPAQVRDLANWCGLSLADAKRGLEANGSELQQLSIGGKVYWFAALRPVVRQRNPVVHLLPNYDELAIGFKDRSALFEPHVTPRASVLSAHFVVVDGRIVGGWRRTIGKKEVVLTAQLLRSLTPAERKGLDAAAARYARSLDVSHRLEAEVIT